MGTGVGRRGEGDGHVNAVFILRRSIRSLPRRDPSPATSQTENRLLDPEGSEDLGSSVSGCDKSHRLRRRRRGLVRGWQLFWLVNCFLLVFFLLLFP